MFGSSWTVLAFMWAIVLTCVMYIRRWPKSEHEFGRQVWIPLRRRFRLVKRGWFGVVPIVFMTFHWLTRASWSTSANSWASVILQLVGAWIVFYAVSQSLGADSWKKMLSALGKWLRAIWLGYYRTSVSADLSPTSAIVAGDGAILRVRRATLEARVEELEREVDALNHRIVEVSIEMRKHIDSRVDELRREISSLKQQFNEAQQSTKEAAWNTIKLECFGALLFTHGIFAALKAT